jgi:exopolysaccharide biosynthesis WecB/TagA/CpsF family protein
MGFFLQQQDIEKINKLLLKAHPFNNYDDAFDLIEKRKERFVISFLNMYALQLSLKNDLFYKAIYNSDLLFFDGIAVKILCKFLKVTYGINMNGTDFIPVLISKLNKCRYSIFASNDEALEMFKKKYVNLQLDSFMNGFYEHDLYVQEAGKNNSDILLLGMGMPKQEILSSMIREHKVIINGGAIVDYMSGYKRRSPRIFVTLKIEWLYRMFYEPKRLLMRYISGFFLLLKIIFSCLIFRKKKGVIFF